MRRRGYVIVFVLVLLVAGIGGFLGGRYLLQALQQDLALQPEANWNPGTPQSGPTGDVAQLPVVVETATPGDAPATTVTPTRGPTATLLVVPAPHVTPLSPAGAAETPTDDASAFQTPSTDEATLMPLVIGEPDGTVTSEDTATPVSAFPFVLAQPVRYSNGDCPGTYFLGLVTDRAGNPLPNVRLSLVDEFGNGETAVTKAGQGDTGRYDFPAFGDPRRFYMQVVDEAGHPLSDRVEVVHNMPPHENQPCRWVDWRRR